MYRGKELLNPANDPGSSTSLPADKATNTLAWSRGIGLELSPLQTRSSRKKKEAESTQPVATECPSQDGKALRAWKALARTK